MTLTESPDYTIPQLARVTQLSDETLRRMCASGRIPGAYNAGLGKKALWRIPREAWQATKDGRAAQVINAIPKPPRCHTKRVAVADFFR